MKNLKKILALVLAFACAFTMFAGAAFTDQADINADNVDAVDLLTTLNIIGGYPDGTFDPEGTVDRAEMAKMIYTIRNDGNTDASAHVDNSTSFTDINGHWAEGYIKYLQNTGIVSGKSATIFDPDAPVTTTEAMKMALVLAGYDEKNAELTGVNWSKNTLTLATTIGLTDNVHSAMTAGCTRQDAAQILANVLSATAVRYSSIVEDFVNDSKDGLAFAGPAISVGQKWMDLCTDIGVLIDLDNTTLDIVIDANDAPDSYHNAAGQQTFTKITKDYTELLGQKVKVLFKDGKNNDVIGVYAVPANDIVTVYQNEIDAEDAKIEIGDTLYTLESDGVVTIVDGDRQDRNWHAVDFVDGTSADVVTLVDTDENGKIDTAVIKTVEVAKVTFASSSQILVNTVPATTYKFSEENIDENVAKDDWVTITENLYEDCKDINVISMATGTVKATKGNTLPASDYQIDDTWYISASDRSNINASVKAGTEVEYISVNGILFYAKKVAGADSKLEDILFVALVGQDGLTNDQARVMFPNGDKATITLSDKKYDSNLDGAINAADADIVAGQFYEYSKSGNEYELSAVRNAFLDNDNKDYYGAYTYWGVEDDTFAPNNLMNGANAMVGAPNPTAPTTVTNVAAIADNADVILYLPMDSTAVDQDASLDILDDNNAADIDSYEILHITGKQLKSNAQMLNGDNLDAQVLGVFSSSVDSLKRSTVIAVRYTDDQASWSGATSNLRSTAHYALITDNAQDLGSTISFPVATDEYNEIITVIADENNTTGFDKGRIIGYDEIVKNDDGTYTIKGADPLQRGEVRTASITAWNNDTIEIGEGNELDRSGFNTEVYTATSNGTINLVADGEPNSLDDGRTNILYWPDSFAFIDVNEIIGQVYAPNVVTYNAGVLANVKSMQWKNAATGETWDSDDLTNIYDGAVMNLSISSDKVGTLTVAPTAGGTALTTYTFTGSTAPQSRTFTVNGPITLTWTAAGAVTPGTNVLTDPSLKELKDALAEYTTVTATGAMPLGAFSVPAGTTLTLDNAMLQGSVITGNVTVSGALTYANANSISGKITLPTGATMNPFAGGTMTAGSIEDQNTTTSAAALATMLAASDDVTVQSTTVNNTMDVTNKKLTVTGDLTVDSMPTAAATEIAVTGAVDAGEVDGDEDDLATILGWSNDVTFGTLTLANPYTIGAGKTVTLAAVAGGNALTFRGDALTINGDVANALDVQAGTVEVKGTTTGIGGQASVAANASLKATKISWTDVTGIAAGATIELTDTTPIALSAATALNGNWTIAAKVQGLTTTNKLTIGADSEVIFNGGLLFTNEDTLLSTDATSKFSVGDVESRTAAAEAKIQKMDGTALKNANIAGASFTGDASGNWKAVSDLAGW